MSHWEQPSGGRDVGLKIFNSLTNTNDSFIPTNGNQVSWYICGPTVYDSSHIGHARNYMTFDIIRRIMTDYFGYDVFFVMNITDVDDKIIIKSHQRHLELLYTFIANEDSASSFRESNQELLEKAKILYATKNAPIAEVSAITSEIKEKAKAAGNFFNNYFFFIFSYFFNIFLFI